MRLYSLAIVLSSICLIMGRNRRVINGGVIERGQWPSLVSLHYMKHQRFTAKTKMHHLCGGTLIDPHWVITTAHCFSDDIGKGLGDITQWQVVLGEHNQYIQDEGEQVLEIKEAIPHPEFSYKGENPNLSNDIALLRLKTPAEMTEYVETIDLNYDKDIENADCEVAGWGQIATEPYGYGMFLPLSTNLTIVNTKTCATAYDFEPILKFAESTLCATFPVIKEVPAGLHVNGACYGDSGGPLICKTGWLFLKRKRLSGIVSGGYNCGDAAYPTVFTNLAYFTGWINNILSSYEDEINVFV